MRQTERAPDPTQVSFWLPAVTVGPLGRNRGLLEDGSLGQVRANKAVVRLRRKEPELFAAGDEGHIAAKSD